MTNGKPGPGGYCDPIKEAWAIRFNLKFYIERPRHMSDSLSNQLCHCRSEEARRIILGISK